MKFNVNGEIVEVKGGGSSNLVNVNLYVTRDGDEQHLFLGVPTGFDINADGLALAHFRKKRMRKKIDNGEDILWLRRNGWHKIPTLPISSTGGAPLFVPYFISKEVAFTRDGYDCYEISFNEDLDYANIAEYLDNEDPSSYYVGNGNDKYSISQRHMLTIGKNAICLTANGQVISNYARFTVSYTKSVGYRISC